MVVVTVEGELDLASATGLQRQILSLLALPRHGIVLDLGGLTFIDSSGLKVLTRVHAAAQDHGVALTLRRVPDQARRVLDITNLTELFAIE